MKTENAKVYSGIVAVMNDISAIGKNRKNAQQGYAFRGVDDVYNALQPALIKNGLVMKPVTLSHNITEHTSRNGGVLFRCIITMEYTIYSVEDGSFITCSTVGEAMDSGDKATNKAMSAAFKYLCFNLFCIPTEEAKDSEIDTHEVAKKTTAPASYSPASAPAPSSGMKPNPAATEGGEDVREWLNLTNKNGSPSAKGQAAIKFIREGGKLSEITKKYKVNKADFAELTRLEQEASQKTTEPERSDDAYHYAESIDDGFPFDNN